MRRIVLLVCVLWASGCAPVTVFACDPVTRADCDGGNVNDDGGSTLTDGGQTPEDGGHRCDVCDAHGLGTADCVSGRCVVRCDDGVLPTETGCELPVSVGVGSAVTCVRTASGRVGCAGASTLGRLSGGAGLEQTLLPEPAAAVSVGAGQACALTTSGVAWCWGSNSSGELGTGAVSASELEPVRVAGGPFVQIAAGSRTTCGLVIDGGVSCWGDNTTPSGSLGFTTPTGNVSTPTPVVGLTSRVTELRAKGAKQTWAWRAGGEVFVWGSQANVSGDVGATVDAGARRLQLPFDLRTVDVGRGYGVTFGVDFDGGVWLWGVKPVLMSAYGSPLVFNADAGPAGYSYFPLPTTCPPDVVDVCLDYSHACVLQRSGAVWCWGDNSEGQLGDGTLVSRDVPQQVPGLVATSIGCFDFMTCATTASGVRCWGRNQSSRFGTALPAQSSTPRLVVTARP